MAYGGMSHGGARKAPGNKLARVGGGSPSPRARPLVAAAPPRGRFVRPRSTGTDLTGITRHGRIAAPVLRVGGPIINDAAPFVPPQYALGDDDMGQFGGFSLKGIAKAVKKVASPVQKAAAAVGHTVGNVATSKIGQGILGTALAVTGVGLPAAAAIGAGVKGVGNLIKPGGNLKHTVTGAAQGAILGVASVGAGKVVRKVGSTILNRGAKSATGAVKTGSDVLIDQVTARGIPPLAEPIPAALPSGPSPEELAAQAQARAQIEQAQRDAEAARAEAARQASEAQAAMEAAKRQGQDEAAAAYQAQMAELERQRAAAEKAAQAAQTASQTASGSQDSGQLQALVDAARQAAQVAQAAAAAPPTPQATAAVQSAAQNASDAATDAAAGAPQEASVMGGLTSNPLLLIGLVAGAAILMGGKKRKSGGRH